MRISLVRISLMQFFKTFHKYLPYANFGLFISLVRFFGYFLLFFDDFFTYNHYGNMGCRVFKWGIQNWKDFCLKINIPKKS